MHRLHALRVCHRRALLGSAVAVALISSVGSSVLAASGTWTNASGGDWSTAATGNWAGGIVASGTNELANFGTLDISGQINVNLAEAITIGSLTFGDTNIGSAGGWTLGGSALTLSGTTPTITVNQLEANSFVQIDSTLTGTAGFTKNGAGTLRLGDSAIPTTFTGTINFNGGTINSNAGFANAVNIGAGSEVTVVNRVNGILGPVGAAGAGAVLNVKTELPFGTVNLRGTWGTGTALSRVNFIGSQDGAGYVDARVNTSAGNVPFNTTASFASTHVHLDNMVFWTRTGSAGNTVNIGALSGTSTAVLSGGGEGGGTFATYVIGALNTSTEFAGNIDITSAPAPFGGLNLTKTGSGTLTLSGNLSYTPTANANNSRRGGITTIQTGTLKLTNNAAIPGGISDGTVGDVYSLVDIRSGATLDVSGASSTYSTSNLQRVIGIGTINGDYRHDEGQLAPGDTIVGTTNNTNSVAGTLAFANNLTIDGGTILFDLTPNPSAGNDKITVGGTLTLGGSATLSPNFIGGASPGTYVIASAASVTGSTSGWSIPWGGRGTGPTFATTATELQLTVPLVGVPESITWTGTNGTAWDINTTFNWRNDTSGASDKFYQNDTVTFADTAGGNPVTTLGVVLNANVAPIEVKVTSNTNNYSFSGSGKITGNAKLTKTGSSTLTISTVNDYLGGSTISGGIVNIGTNGSAFGGAASGVTLSNATIQNAGVSIAQVLTLPAGSTSTLDFNGTPSTGAITPSGGFTGDGNLTIVGVASGRLLDFGSTAGYTGDITVSPSILADTTQGTFVVRLNGGGASFANSVITLGAGATLADRATSVQTLDLGELHGAAGSILRGYQGGSGATAKTWRIGALNTDSAFAGNLANGSGSGVTVAASNILKVGSGSLTLSGNILTTTTTGGVVNYSGSFAIEAGRLILAPSVQEVVLGGPNVTATPGGLDIRGGKVVMNYVDAPSGDALAASVLAILDPGYDLPTKFLTGKIRSTTLAAGRTLGWKNAGTSVDVAYTLPGDTDLNFAVNFDDLLALAQNYDAAGSGKVWANGDINYDGIVNFDDLLGLAQNYGGTVLTQSTVESTFGTAFAQDWELARSIVPEPASLGLVAGGLIMARRRRA